VAVDIGDFGFRDIGLLALLLWRLLALWRRPALPFLLGPRDRLPKCFNITDWQNGRASGSMAFTARTAAMKTLSRVI
jgi:hypothetical protein